MDNCFLTFSLFLISLCIFKVMSLECYACYNQAGNKDKCIKTTIQCLEGQNICQSNISWQLPPYWTPHGDRLHVVSKSCSTARQCNRERDNMTPFCKRDWYSDWKCVECCSGDMCNYYVTMEAGSLRPHLWLSVVCAGAVVMTIRRWL